MYLVGAGYSPVRGNVCEADKRVPVFGEKNVRVNGQRGTAAVSDWHD